eukprot:CAMPEP_0174721678 /NCGR_PEP_ID=MMETSP1094-20130205/36867_1 /TAXON_ID=156173 /ORGANISM="Chrysochromulina brevifilum, Strain UTEX LB 985" /LENGTH=60 /DNA_ID=CAMNT_0015922417 /DNA_START=171 /DNA_END=353 /DNA_ORIENTATION=+
MELPILVGHRTCEPPYDPKPLKRNSADGGLGAGGGHSAGGGHIVQHIVLVGAARDLARPE